ncbi:hypothetical protein CB1_000765048 [Camelus ferus]|nr:hypothetical protein CB1_000765048 [Camelus ferus]
MIREIGGKARFQTISEQQGDEALESSRAMPGKHHLAWWLLGEALSYTPVEVKESDEKTKRDINRFLSVASLQGLIHEGTMTSLCMAMTEEQHRSVIIDCSGSRPQFHNAAQPETWAQPPGLAVIGTALAHVHCDLKSHVITGAKKTQWPKIPECLARLTLELSIRKGSNRYVAGRR